MSKSSYSIFDFLKDCRGNWRNAIFIPCSPCRHPCTNQYQGCLLVADDQGRPRVVCVSRFEGVTGQKVEGSDCVGTLSRAAFESAFLPYLLWEQDDPELCCLRHLDHEVSTTV